MVLKDSQTGNSRGFGFVTFATQEGADQCLGDRNQFLKKKKIDCRPSLPKSAIQNKRNDDGANDHGKKDTPNASPKNKLSPKGSDQEKKRNVSNNHVQNGAYHQRGNHQRKSNHHPSGSAMGKTPEVVIGKHGNDQAGDIGNATHGMTSDIDGLIIQSNAVEPPKSDEANQTAGAYLPEINNNQPHISVLDPRAPEYVPYMEKQQQAHPPAPILWQPGVAQQVPITWQPTMPPNVPVSWHTFTAQQVPVSWPFPTAPISMAWQPPTAPPMPWQPTSTHARPFPGILPPANENGLLQIVETNISPSSAGSAPLS